MSYILIILENINIGGFFMSKYYIIIKTPIGELTLSQNEDFITGVLLDEKPSNDLINEETPLLKTLKEQLLEYFAGTRKEFTVPFAQKLTPFQKEVYEVLALVPYGYTLSYGDVAYLLGKDKGARAVGNALSKNNILILVPCHRVLGKDSLGGFTSSIEAKKKLLKVEGSAISE